MYKGKHEKQQYDPEMPCNKKRCDASTRASCCGCPEQLEYERKKKEEFLRKQEPFMFEWN